MRDLLKNHAVAAFTSTSGTISATALHHYRGLNLTPAWFGAIDDADVPEDLARNVDKHLATEGFGSYRS